jgi:hypothetical protein
MLLPYDEVMAKLKSASWPLTMGFLKPITKKGTLVRECVNV